MGKTLEFSLYLAIRPRLTKFCMQLYLVGSTKSAQGMALGSNLAPPGGHKFYMGLYREKLPNLPISSHKA